MVTGGSSSWEAAPGAPEKEVGSMIAAGCLGRINLVAGATADAISKYLDGSWFV